MKKITKTYYFLDEEDKKNIKKQMLDMNLKLKDIAKTLGLSSAYVSSILNGERNLTDKIIEQFASVGIKLDIGK